MKNFRAVKILVLAAMMVMAYATVAFAGAQNFTLYNNTGYTIYQVNISPANTNDWEEDILGSNVLMNGESTYVNFDAGNTQYWDIQAIFEDGTAWSWYGFDLLSTYDVILNADGSASYQ